MAAVGTEGYRVKEGEEVRLGRWPPGESRGIREPEALEESRKLTARLEKLQEKLYAEHRHKVLVILQAMDTGGKDGTIKKVFEGVNPQGVRVEHFRTPTPEESDHDFLWRVHEVAPASGEMVIFNRSHYEGVLIERVHGLVPRKTWERRYKEIRHFERLLHDDHTLVLKFFLHIDKAEQKRRLEERLTDPSKQWKFSSSDLQERKHWADYMKAYRDALEKTSTDSAPWYVIPANKKWFRDYLVSRIVVDSLEALGMEYPPPSVDLRAVKI
ncbi:MAG: polyphosphate kinase 2 family protein [Nitrososphaerota archaeon]|nr:polyphosphate kinase 2 family protein [Nitrososphaerota archaeon]MDG6966577.1 polyphosphate kinase 2 family protein [Nitrososphaerota archaeon]MDG6978564.1 polyphosphate kinase 2 family protein [Nitrososphaerota archaeon]MDG7005943.1 polyphosphate kinase 2 family protein [Nitrososphaerota archaeon]MDG7020754.1 polyphosphate kinase 2 family protein [Nitrososphaerota archaeon]